MRKFQIFYHIAVMESWQQSHDIIKTHFGKSDILENCDKIFYCINGKLEGVKEYVNLNEKINHEFVHLREDYIHYEFPTINFLREKCLTEDMDVLYIHTKGASRPANKRNGRNNHLDNMCYNCIWHYLECRNKLLENYDAVGLAYGINPFPHFSGNIWWAKSEHIRKLKKLEYGIRNFNDKEHPDRHDAEKWICSVKGNFYNIFYEYKDSRFQGYTYADDNTVETASNLPEPNKQLINTLGFDFSEYTRSLKAIESGGPSTIYEELNIYQKLVSCDNILFARDVSNLNKLGGLYQFCGKKMTGNLYWCDATDMKMFADNSYDLLLSSNNLEHIANPLRALYEWRRVIKNEGYIMLVLPRKESNFDHRRPITSFEHIISDFNNNIQEDDMTHLDEIFALHDLERDPYAKPMSWFQERSRDNLKHRCLHHHVFDAELIQQIFNFMNFTTIKIVNDYRNFYALAKNTK